MMNKHIQNDLHKYQTWLLDCGDTTITTNMLPRWCHLLKSTYGQDGERVNLSPGLFHRNENPFWKTNVLLINVFI